jgi:DNA-binding transcriptional LysR family regulator
MTNPLETIPWARRLKLRHLEVFIALHEAGSLTAAASQLHMTQPALSHWLADIEEVVGRPLFVRGRRFTLTEAGEVLRAHAVRMLGDVERTHADLQAVQAGLSGRLHVGTGLPRVLLPKAIARLQQDKPGVFVSVTEGPLPALLERLEKRDIDIIIGALNAQALRSGFATETLFKERVLVVGRSAHPIFSRDRVSWADTNHFPWILPPVGAVMRDVLDEAFAVQGLKPPVPCVEANSSVRVQLLMEERDYLSILTASEVQMYRSLGIIETLPLAPAIPFPDIGALWEAERCSPLTARFLEALRVEAGRLV